jgi:ribonuclease P protein component
VVEEAQGEAHVSAEQPSSSQAARLPPSHADPGRAGDHPVPPSEGPRAAVGLTWRVRDRATFEALRRQGRRARRGVVGVTYLPADAGPPRIAYGVGRKVGPAVVRNRVRRRLRAAARELARDPGLAPGAYLVTVAPRAAHARYGALRADLADACAAATRPADGRT